MTCVEFNLGNCEMRKTTTKTELLPKKWYFWHQIAAIIPLSGYFRRSGGILEVK